MFEHLHGRDLQNLINHYTYFYFNNIFMSTVVFKIHRKVDSFSEIFYETALNTLSGDEIIHFRELSDPPYC